MTDITINAAELSLSGIANAFAGIYPNPPASITVSSDRLRAWLSEALPHLNDFEIDELMRQTISLFGVPLVIEDD